jgi:hypothetical protein
MAYTTLYDYYTSLGQSLPSISTRAQLYQQAGLGSATSYAGTAAQNTSLLNYLQQAKTTTTAPAPTPTTTAPTPTYQAPAPTPTAAPAPAPTSAPAPAPAPTTTQQTNLYSGAAGYTGPSIIDFLTKAGQPSTYAARQALATQYGISNYTGTATQNTQLLNILKGFASGSVSPLGVPNTVSGGTMPTPSTPINAADLSSGTQDLSKILGANIPAGSVNSDIAGLLSLYGASTDSQKQYDEMTTKLTSLMESLGNEGADLQAAMDAQGVGAAYQQVKELNLKAAQLKGQIEQFDAETLQQKTDLAGQAIPTGLINGQQAQYQQQRDLTKIGMVANLSATIALSQAYQGNAELGLELAKNAVDMKYAPILNQINVLKTQIGFASEKLNREDSVRSKIIGTLLEFKVNEINQQKETQTQIQSMAIQAAANGAPLSVVNAIRNSTDAVSAASAGAAYLKGSLESIAKSGSGSGGSGGGSFTQTQLNKGAANAGMSIADFTKLSADSKNWYINSYSTFQSVLNSLRAGDGKYDAQSVLDQINSSTSIPADVKAKLIAQVQPYVKSDSGGGGFWSSVGGFFKSAWEGIKSIF